MAIKEPKHFKDDSSDENNLERNQSSPVVYI